LSQAKSAGRPSFGASIADASTITAKQGTGTILGAYIGRVRPGSVAGQAGLAPGDIIIEVNMQRIANAGDLERVLTGLNSGSRFSLVYLRSNKTMTGEGTF